MPREVGELAWLKSLNLASTPVRNVAPLARLSNLHTLDVSNTEVTDLGPLAGLSALQTLNVSNMQVTNLAPLACPSALHTLDVSNTQISDLSALVALIAQGCPVRWSSDPSLGPDIYVESCPLINPPPEIVNQGNEAILNYFQERRSGQVDHLYEAKLLIVGEGGAGKTSLLRRLYQPGQPLPAASETTKSISIHRHEFELKNTALPPERLGFRRPGDLSCHSPVLSHSPVSLSTRR